MKNHLKIFTTVKIKDGTNLIHVLNALKQFQKLEEQNSKIKSVNKKENIIKKIKQN